MTTTAYTLTCLTPVHIGTGVQYSKFDGAYHDRHWHVIDLDRVLAQGADANALARAMHSPTFSWSDWLGQQRITPTAGALYTLPCPQDPADTPVREAMKTVYQQPYVPGTSVKGAIRTAILRSLLTYDDRALQEAKDYITLRLRSFDLMQALERMEGGNSRYSNPQAHERALAQVFGDERVKALRSVLYRALNRPVERLQRSDFERFAEWHWQRKRVEVNPHTLDDPIEQFVLGRTPNHDLLRALQVSDTAPVELERLAVGLVWTYTLRGHQLVEKREQEGEYKAFVEWLTPGTTLRLTLRLDDFLYTDAAKQALQFRDRQVQAIRQLAHTCNAYARTVIAAEQEFYATYGPESLHELYTECAAMLDALPDGAFLLNIGWGGGWEVKTVGALLRKILGAQGFLQLRQRYGLGRSPRTGQLTPNAPFPKTRRLAYEAGAAHWALGWVTLVPQES
ncbi:MAG: type III-A CRISPR-associated RAMP protein Csm5 [candidate division KSB1 bacterium]|nr:type III-A CRISPR-associated RAMP protein Csm5 [candidate division KSB1 bacterium]